MHHKTRWTSLKIAQRLTLIQPLIYRRHQPLTHQRQNVRMTRYAMDTLDGFSPRSWRSSTYFSTCSRRTAPMSVGMPADRR